MRKRVSGCLIVSLLGGATAGLAQTSAKASDGPASPQPMIDELRAKRLLIPVPGVAARDLIDTFRQPRGEKRVHYALDIPAPRGTPILSTDSGRVLKLFNSKAGGLTVYAIDPTGKYIYYYAHLEQYRFDLAEGMRLGRGDTIGYVGTSGNAPANVPHLHFTILRALSSRQWSRGTPINPAKVF
jgi:peptidoglycan LD-endopeptidase LytH